MWYSRFSTGLPEIDIQHANIDMLLRLYMAESKPDEKELWLNQIVSAIRNHFQFEELYFGNHFPEEHRKEHRLLLQQLIERTDNHRKETLDQSAYVKAAQDMLVTHVRIFDMPLGELESQLNRAGSQPAQ